MSLSSPSDTAELPPEETEWNQKWQAMNQLGMSTWKEVEQLMRKRRIPCGDPKNPTLIDWSWDILPDVFAKRLGMSVKEMKKYDAFHPFIGSSYKFGVRFPNFDTINGDIEKCARELLEELRRENASRDVTVLQF